MQKVSVRFNYGLSNNNKIFGQPLYYLAEHIRYKLNNIIIPSHVPVPVQNNEINNNNNNNEINNENNENNEIDIKYKRDNLNFINIVSYGNKDGLNDIINLEMCETNGWGDVQLFYKLNKNNNNIKFSYKGVEFQLNNVDTSNIKSLMKEHGNDFLVYSAYEIIYNAEDVILFEEFINNSITYYEKYYCMCNDKTKNTFEIYITSQEGFYFTHLGKRNKRCIDSVYLPIKYKQDIINDLTNFLKPETKKRYNKLGITYKRIYLLEGIPGSGKTSLIAGLASQFNFNIAIVSFVPKMTDVDLIMSLRTLKEFDANDANSRKTFLVFEDIDCIFKERKANDESRNTITFSGLLNALDGITTNEIVCFITTNFKVRLDNALIRPGRVDYVMTFDYAIKEQILNIFKDFTSETNNDIIHSFYNECCKLNIKITTALLQQYLMKYIDKPKEAIDNIEEMKRMFDTTNVSKDADSTGLYS